MTPAAAARQLAEAWEEVTGQSATPEIISVLWAHWAHETGRGKWMVDYNFAGLKGRAPGGASSVWWTTEHTGDDAQRIRRRFRAYATAEEGAHDYVRVLHARFDHAFAAASEGDARAFARALAEQGYFTAPDQAYERSVVRLSREFREGPLAREVTHHFHRSPDPSRTRGGDPARNEPRRW